MSLNAPRKRNERRVSRPGAQTNRPSRAKTAELYRIPRRRISRTDAALALVVVIGILLFIVAVGFAYNIGYALGTEFRSWSA